MALFQLIEGLHKCEDGRFIKGGECVESAADLTETYRNKFVKVDPAARPVMAKANEPYDPIKAMQGGGELATYRLNEGTHMHNGRLMRGGDTIKSTYPLDKMFVNRFTQVEADPPGAPVGDIRKLKHMGMPMVSAEVMAENKAAIEAQGGKVTPIVAAGAPAPVEAPATTRLGKDVTAQFPLATQEDFLVYNYKGLFFTYDKDTPTAPALSPAGTDKAGVTALIQAKLDAATA
jgi:hypothetical protein